MQLKEEEKYMTACTRSTVKGLKHNHIKVIPRDNMTIRLYTDKITNNIHVFQFLSLLIKGPQGAT